ncbi:diacylglycerol kinase family protein [Alienimonas sp. DA493]|uniref:diacylglycerol kinase family protein n=1 Tax=Alienimonas sp. DA493 TaxID=3373605 RepID=UPI00375482C0
MSDAGWIQRRCGKVAPDRRDSVPPPSAIPNPSSPRRPPRPGFTPAGRWSSFIYAARGLRMLIRTQPNARLHAAAALLVTIAGLALGVDAAGWCRLAASVAAVWAAEAFNTAFELLCDVVHPDYHPMVRDAKDAAAGAVLAVSLGAAAVGAFTLGPPLWLWLTGPENAG